MRDGPRLPKYHVAGLSKEETERAHRSGRFDMSADEGPSDSGSFTEKGHQVERRRADATRQVRAAKRMGLCIRGLTTKSKVREDKKLRELIQANERAPTTPTPPNGTRKAFCA